MLLEKVTKMFWNYKQETEIKLLDYLLEEQSMKLYVKINFDESNDEKLQNAKIRIKSRNNNLFYDFDISYQYSDKSYKIGSLVVPLETFIYEENETWDFYLNIPTNKRNRLIRMEEVLSRPFDRIYFPVNKQTMIKPYSTVHGNFSVKSTYNIMYPILVDIEEVETTLGLRGKIYGMEINDHNNLFLVFKNKYTECESEYSVQIKQYPKHTIFETKINLENLFSLQSNVIQEYDLFVKLEGPDNESSIIVPLTTNDEKELTEQIIVITDKLYKIEYQVKAKSKQLSVVFTEEGYDVETDELFVYSNSLYINGTINNSMQKNINGNYVVLLTNRSNEATYQDTLSIKDSKFSYVLNLEQFVESDIITHGIWDLYLKIGERKFRFKNTCGIDNKRSIIQFPQVQLANNKSEITVVKPYYTLYNEVSLLVRNYISNKRLMGISMKGNTIKFQGLLNIQTPNDNVPEYLNGKMHVRLPYGLKEELPIEAHLFKTNKTQLEFKYEITAQLGEENRNKIKDNLNFDLIQFQLEFDKGSSIFYINALPTLKFSPLERFINQHQALKKALYKFKLKAYYVMNKILPINSKVFIFQCTTGMNYSCNPRGIYEEMLTLEKGFKPVWVLNNENINIDGNPIIVRPNTLKYYYYMAIGKYFINNGNFPDFYQKRNGTIHLQTWHGTPLKKLGHDIDPSSPSYKENTSKKLMKRISRWDYLIAPNEYTGEILKRAFLYENKLLNVGYPRNDILYKDQAIKRHYIKETKRYLNIPNDKKVILYAPTWRDNDFHRGLSNQPYNFQFSLDEFTDKFGDEYVLLVRLHPREAVRCQIKDYENVIYNVTNFNDIKFLYLISDILITDYSSVMFDFANTKKPMLFFAYDIEQYSSELRGFYFDFQKSAPGPIVTSEEELFNAIKEIKKVQELYQEKYEKFYDKFCSWEDGSSANRIINEVFKGY